MRIGEQVWEQLKTIDQDRLGLRELMYIDEAIHRGEKLEKLFRTCRRFKEACESGHERGVIQDVILDLVREITRDR